MTTQEKDNINKVKASLQQQLDDINKLEGINSLILSVCLVDALAGFYCGYDGKPSGNKKRYEKFVDKYLSAHKTYLYDIRCNLTHSFSNSIVKYIFMDNKEFTRVFGSTLSILDHQLFSINNFKVDLSSAFANYFIDLINNNDLNIQSNFQTRFNCLNILEDGVIGTVRNSKGELINNIDQADTMPGINLKTFHASPTPIKK